MIANVEIDRPTDTASDWSQVGLASSPSISPGCRARRLRGGQKFSECLVNIMTPCAFGAYYDDGRLCEHPQHEAICARLQVTPQSSAIGLLVQGHSPAPPRATA